jgi:hypothetical protein
LPDVSFRKKGSRKREFLPVSADGDDLDCVRQVPGIRHVKFVTQEEVMTAARNIRRAVAFALLASAGVAFAAEEVEPNFPMSAAQPLEFDVTGVATVNAFMESGSADVFSFFAKQGDVVTLDIDGGVKNTSGSIDTIMSLHHPLAPTLPGAGSYQVMTWNDDGAAPDAGSLGAGDSYISNVVIPADGVYFVAVTGYMNRVLDGGTFSGSPTNATGSYTLIVSGVSQLPPPPAPEPEPDPADPDPAPEPEPETPPTTETPPSPFPTEDPMVRVVAIDIKPGTRMIARIDPKSRRDIPVAILAARGFDVRRIDRRSLTFGKTGDEQSLERCERRRIDINRDRRGDLICFFQISDAGFDATDEQAILRGTLKDGTPFEGTGALKVIAEKRKNHSWHGHDHRGHDHDRRDSRNRNNRR